MSKEIFNFANRQMCEYASIFPTTVALLDHLLFTIGNGYTVDPESGMIVDMGGERIDEVPPMTPEDWVKLIEYCKKKERDFAVEFARGETINEDRLAKKCEQYYPRNVTEHDFTEQKFFEDIVACDQKCKSAKWGEKHYRPYPLSERHSDIYNLNENTPAWLIKIALNLCNAWVRFLTQAIETGDVCTSKEHDYADMKFTARHRDMLAELSSTLASMLEKKNA